MKYKLAQFKVLQGLYYSKVKKSKIAPVYSVYWGPVWTAPSLLNTHAVALY